MKLTQFRPSSSPGPRVEGSTALSESEGLQAFGSETAPPPKAPEPPHHPAGVKVRIAPSAVLPLILAAMVGATAGAAGLRAYQYLLLGRSNGSVRIETTVPGVEVSLAGKSVGRTPVALSLAPGSYPVQLAGSGVTREFTLDVTSGASILRQIELPTVAPAALAGAVGSLLVQTEPTRLPISIDGVEKGMSPLTVSGLAPGEHHVSVRSDGSVIRRTVTIQPNENTVLVVSPVERAVPAAIASAAGGWVAVTSPLALTIREGGKVLGSTDSERLMLTAGEHALELSNESLGFQTKRTLRIEAGKTAALKIDPPNGTLSINAQPWAEVWVDGQRVGETPIGKLQQPIGVHEVVLRHPDLGERRETVTITLRQPARLGVDMRRK